MGSYIYEQTGKSPLADLVKTPEFAKPLVDTLYSPIQFLGETFDRPEDQVVYMVASTVMLVANFGLYYHRGTPFQRQLYSTTAGLMIHYYVFGLSGLASLLTNIFSYLAICIMPRSQSHVAIFIVSGLGLGFAQLHRQIYYYGWNGLDVPMNLMFNFCRVSSLACCIRDGHYMTKAEKDGKEPDLKPREKAFAIKEIPSFFDFMSYLYYCGAAISGPWYEYKDFMDMIHQRGDFKEIPSTIKPGLIRFAHAWMLVATGAILAQFADEKFALSDEFVNDYSLARKWWNLYMILKMIMQIMIMRS